MIHGGGQVQGERSEIEGICKAYSLFGFITVSMNYSLLNKTEYESNIFRILDEVSSIMKAIKLKLIPENFDENQLELEIGGGSLCAHISMLYSYLVKNPDYYLINKNLAQILEKIDPESIENAIKEGLIELLVDKNLDGGMSNFYLINFMNYFLWKKFDDNLDEIYNKETNKINKESEKYEKLLEEVKYAFPISHVTDKTPPTICAYGGKDILVGLGQYVRLKKAFDNNNNKNIVLAYFRYGSHNLDLESEKG